MTKQVYERGDPVSSPSGENVITYRWASGRFAEQYRTHNDYSNAAGNARLRSRTELRRAGVNRSGGSPR